MTIILTGRQPRRGRDGGWVYSLTEQAMADEGLQEGETYVFRPQNTFAKLIMTSTIMDLCLAAAWRMGSKVANRWWDQDGLDLEGMPKADREAERTEWEEDTDGTETD